MFATFTPALTASLHKKSVLITGGASGIGAELVTAFLAAGAQTAFIDNNHLAGQRLCQQLKKRYKQTPLFFSHNLLDWNALKTSLATIKKKHHSLHILVNNAANDRRHAFSSFTPQEWDELIAINLKAYFFTIQYSLPLMKKQKNASIINLSSNSFMVGVPNLSIYASAKAGIVGLTRVLAKELGIHNIRVNCLLPGWVMTPKQKKMHLSPDSWQECLQQQALKIKIQSKDIAHSVLFFASDWSRAITGQSLIIDAGRILQ